MNSLTLVATKQSRQRTSNSIFQYLVQHAIFSTLGLIN